jgi:hypothetical protein
MKTIADPEKCYVGNKVDRKTFLTCYDKNLLIELINGYNHVYSDDPIEYNNGTMDTKELWDLIEAKMYSKYKCQSEWCWIDQDFIQSLHYDVQKLLKKKVFKPIMPKSKYAWLSSIDILDIMRGYEDLYPDFKFYGPYPRDFQKFLNIYTEMKDFDLATQFLNQYKRIGFIFNLDYQRGPGTHWTALFINLKDKPYTIEYFDSVGNIEPGDVENGGGKKRIDRDSKVPTEFKKFILENVCTMDVNGAAISVIESKRLGGINIPVPQKTNCPLKVENFIDIVRGTAAFNFNSVLKPKYSTIRHQKKDTECGVYAVNFIVERLNGKSFEDIVNNIISDDEMNKKRETTFFRPRS